MRGADRGGYVPALTEYVELMHYVALDRPSRLTVFAERQVSICMRVGGIY